MPSFTLGVGACYVYWPNVRNGSSASALEAMAGSVLGMATRGAVLAAVVQSA